MIQRTFTAMAFAVATGLVAHIGVADAQPATPVAATPDPAAPGAPDNVFVLPCAELLTDSIRRIFTDGSVSEVFGGENQLF